ncbi:MAG: antibiotic biosynthesis monooxygenase [Candidatus Melainabacteria bacterium]|nr:MAG: antibiotic biosynthesis monooxygenase [Candidatus Melainabacteria bacterium]
MFAVIYNFKVRQGQEQEFELAWCKRTEEIKNTYGGLGSRLHRASDGRWIAYAQWPSRERWVAASKDAGETTEAQLAMRAACESVETLFELDVRKDLLTKHVSE